MVKRNEMGRRVDSKGRDAKTRYLHENRKARMSRACKLYAASNWMGRTHNPMAVLISLQKMPRTIFGDRFRADVRGIAVPSNGKAYRDVQTMLDRYGADSDLYRSAVRNWEAGLHRDRPYRPPLP